MLLEEVLNLKEDRVSTVDLDPSEGRGKWSLTTTGKPRHLPVGAGVSIDYTFQVKAKFPQLKKAGKKGKKS